MRNRIEWTLAERWAEVARAESAPVDADRLAAALLAVADTSRSVTRDGDLEIANAAQFVECAKAADRLAGLDPADRDVARRAGELIAEVERGRGFRWDEPVRTAALCAVAAVVAVGGAVLGGVVESVPLVVVTAVLGNLLLFATVLTARRPMWRVRAELMAPMIRAHGI
ncbi:hypothetical protein ACFFQW_47375 [Umezawaea endophytica]|uniref:Uncharacterized protein n=1 Tax=Umezawaea endophytica TaxID=1654476 RepID=A0A9X2VJG4_9PSEU|nr:hypothetical protein [Umezawaea endophytica]MCS7477760.1 hypothetical protein [Umezawaea endophytica]